MKWTEKAMQKVLTSGRGPIPYHRYIAVPNVSWGFSYVGEADVIACSIASGYAREYEIKISVADLKRDKRKTKHLFWDHPENLVSELWYAMPLEVAEAVNWGEHVPDYAGVVAFSHDSYGFLQYKILRRAKRKKDAVKLTAEQLLKLARLGCLRLWSKLQKEADE